MSDQPHHFVAGPCWSCGRLISFNPHTVPSIPIGDDGKPAIGGDRKPLCLDCVTLGNAARRERGEPEWTVHEDAYAPVPGLPE